MTEVTVGHSLVLIELRGAADDFAARAQSQEIYRDRALPGTSAHHLHAHSATLWRLAESSLRARIRDLEAVRLS
jgi:hypothetical protein